MQDTEVYQISGKKYVEDGRFYVFANVGHLSNQPDLNDELLQRTNYRGEFFIQHEFDNTESPSVVMEYIDERRVRLSDRLGILVIGQIQKIYGSLSYIDFDSGATYSYSENVEVVIPQKVESVVGKKLQGE